MIFDRFYPQEWVDSTYEIDWKFWQKKGIRGAIFDIDNTLVPHGAPADAQVKTLFHHLHHMGIRTCLLSNNKEPRVSSFATEVNSPYIYKAGKPAVRNYKKAMELMGTHPQSTVTITGNFIRCRTGIYGILVKPINPKEEIQIVLKRYLEAVVLHFYQQQNKNK